ncbi:MAG: hypothetical protein ACREEC_14390 [Thermoplasmata archaeon]
MSEREFDRAMRKASEPYERVLWFGALLGKESGLDDTLVVVGGFAIEVYTRGEYVSEGVDVVGAKVRIVPVLRRWKFTSQLGRDHRTYWFKEPLGLVDLVGVGGRSGPPPTVMTPHGPVQLGPVEDLIIRSLMRSEREHSVELFREAEILAHRYTDSLDWDYLQAGAKHEHVLPLYRQLRRPVG